MDNNAILDQLKYSLQGLAQPADVQLSLFPSFVIIADEIALDFDNWNRVVITNNIPLTSTQKTLLKNLDTFLSDMSKSSSKEKLWTASALRESSEWETVRSLAKRILQEFGWELNKPPSDKYQFISSGKRLSQDK